MKLALGIGIDDLQLGMSERDVVLHLGPPRLKRTNFRKEDEMIYDSLTITLGPDSTVAEISALPESRLTYNDREIFSDPNLWREFIKKERDPREYVGIVVLPSFQLALSGFHDQDPSQQTITIFAEGRWDHLLPKSKPFKFAV